MAGRKVIVVFKEGTPNQVIEDAVNKVVSEGATVTQRYESALLGFAAQFPEVSAHALTALEQHPALDYIEDDGVVSIC